MGLLHPGGPCLLAIRGASVGLLHPGGPSVPAIKRTSVGPLYPGSPSVPLEEGPLFSYSVFIYYMCVCMPANYGWISNFKVSTMT